MNLVENTHGTGAVWTPKDESVPVLRDVAKDTQPFDWSIGFSVPELTTKNQGSSSSCGGQAASYKASVGGTEKSAHFVYGPIAYPSGGTSEPDISNRLINVGVCDEALCPSYKGTKPPTESFMTTTDFSPDAIKNATLTKFGSRIYVNRNFEDFAQAIRDHNGIIIGVYGINNGTWLTSHPKAPQTPPDDTMWRHFLYVGKAFMKDGIKYIGVKNSWGNVGDNGWQYLDQTYLPYIWTSFTYADLAIPHGFYHRFNTQMKLGDSGTEVKALQQALKLDGEFPSTQVCTGYYGSLTQNAVNSFQIKYAKDILAPLALTKPTGRVGERTLLMLNSLYNH